MLSRVPFVFFVIFIIAGILLDEYVVPHFSGYFPVLAFIIVVLFSASFFFYRRNANRNFGVVFSLFLLFSGVAASFLQNERLKSDLEYLSENEYSSYEAIVKSLPEKRAKSVRVEAIISRTFESGKWISRNIKVLISIPLEASVIPKPGDHIVVNGKVDRPGKALNPEEFDYQRYLWNKGIVWTDYLKEGSYRIYSPEFKAFNPAIWSSEISEWADRKFRENITDDRSYGLVKAMLLGRRDDLRSDQVDDYTTSGTVHILSVSGMHVAIIFLAISLALGWLKRWPVGKFAYLVSVTTLLCFYALVTGLPPSVQRATLMCIVFVVAEAFGRKQSSMNTLAISALLILVFDTHALYDVGFQLSFLAMSGIFLLYQPIEAIGKPTNPILKYVWQITAMSFAAQLATFPLSLYYFHQFPFYFWLVNPFVILFTNFLLPAAMVLLIVSLSGLTWLQIAVNWLVEMSAYLTNISVAVPKLLPGYLIENLYLDKIEVILLYIFIFMGWYSYHKQEYLFLKRSFAVVLLFVIYSCSSGIQTYLTSNAVIHSVPGHSVISFKQGDRLYISSDKEFVSDSNAYQFRIKNYAISQGVSETVFLLEETNSIFNNLVTRKVDNGMLLFWHGMLISRGEDMHSPDRLDYSIFSSTKIPSTGQIMANRKTTFVPSGQIRGKRLEKWKDHLASSGQKFYDLSNGSLLLH